MTEAEPTKRIFVGGLGRSGTTILTQLIGLHSDVFGMEWETRFVVDNDGLGDLVDSLSLNWAGPVTGGEKIRRFRRMMTRDLVDREAAPYEGYNLHDHFAPENYDTAVRDFLDGLVEAEWPAFSMHSGRSFHLVTRKDGEEVHVQVRAGERSRILPRYFTRAEAAGRAAEFVDRLFGGEARRRGRRHWCEKTPHNILSPYPRLLFPDSYIVHIIRDPRDVVSSIGSGRHSWGGPDPEVAARWVHSFYLKWLATAPAYRDDERYIEVFFEDLIGDPKAVLTSLCERLGLDPQPEMWNADLSRHNIGRHRTHLNSDDLAFIEREIIPLACRAGYGRYWDQ